MAGARFDSIVLQRQWVTVFHGVAIFAAGLCYWLGHLLPVSTFRGGSIYAFRLRLDTSRYVLGIRAQSKRDGHLLPLLAGAFRCHQFNCVFRSPGSLVLQTRLGFDALVVPACGCAVAHIAAGSRSMALMEARDYMSRTGGTVRPATTGG
jgi:hypothetical protein